MDSTRREWLAGIGGLVSMGFLNRGWVDFDFLGGGTTEADDLAPRHLTGDYTGKIRAISGSEVVASIDPADSSTPIQDAIDAIGRGISYPGVIELPLGVETPGQLKGLGGKTVIGPNTHGSTVIDTDPATTTVQIDTRDDIAFSDLKRIRFENQTTPRSAPAFEWNSIAEEANQDSVWFNNYTGHDIHVFQNGGGAWSSHWESIHARMYNRFINWGDADIPGLSIGNILFRSDDSATPEIEKTNTNSTGFISVETWNKGQVACPVFVGTGGTDLSGVVFGPGNYEPSTTATIDQIFKFGYLLRVSLDHFSTHGNYTLNKTPILAANNQGNMNIMSTEGLTVESDNSGPLLWKGNSANLVKGPNTPAGLTQGVACLGDLTLQT